MYKYKWQDSYDERFNNVVPKRFIEKIFDLLNNGIMYTDIGGRFMGYITLVHGPLGSIQIVSDHSLMTDDRDIPFITIRVVYCDVEVLHFRMDSGYLSVFNFVNGHWANTIGRIEIKINEE